MITINRLGNLGRLANQMFQYASLKGIAKNRGFNYSLPPREFFGKEDVNVKNSDVILYDVFPNIEKSNEFGFNRANALWERRHDFDEELFLNCPDDIDLVGYFQTEKYFKHIEDEIREDFTFDEELLTNCKSFISNNFDTEIISLHIRRGDYVVNPNHPTQSLDYYSEALNRLESDLPVIIFSDDPQWCKEQELFSDDRFVISENNTTDADLCLMSLCDYHIIANSSFSWWGAWLAKSKQVIAPKNWFGGECAGKSTADVPFGNFEFL